RPGAGLLFRASRAGGAGRRQHRRATSPNDRRQQQGRLNPAQKNRPDPPLKRTFFQPSIYQRLASHEENLRRILPRRHRRLCRKWPTIRPLVTVAAVASLGVVLGALIWATPSRCTGPRSEP